MVRIHRRLAHCLRGKLLGVARQVLCRQFGSRLQIGQPRRVRHWGAAAAARCRRPHPRRTRTPRCRPRQRPQPRDRPRAPHVCCPPPAACPAIPKRMPLWSRPSPPAPAPRLRPPARLPVRALQGLENTVFSWQQRPHQGVRRLRRIVPVPPTAAEGDEQGDRIGVASGLRLDQIDHRILILGLRGQHRQVRHPRPAPYCSRARSRLRAAARSANALACSAAASPFRAVSTSATFWNAVITVFL